MKRSIIILSLISFLSTMGVGASAFQSFRCGPNLVRVGETTLEVLLECGPPTYKELRKIETETSPRGVFPYGRPYNEVTQIIETWYYNCGPNRFIKILTFRGGILKKIDVGHYGSGASDCIGAERRKGTVEGPLRSEALEYGRISVFGFPQYAQVYLDGKPVGELPCTIEDVAPGRHELSVAKAGYKDWRRNVRVIPGETLHLEINLDFIW